MVLLHIIILTYNLCVKLCVVLLAVLFVIT